MSGCRKRKERRALSEKGGLRPGSHTFYKVKISLEVE
jgi:hypothetical protein